MINHLLTDALAGIAGGVAYVLVGQPLDTIKVKMQVFPNTYTGMITCFRAIVAKHGLRGLYAGTVPALTSSCVDNAVLFGTYGQCQNAVAAFTGSRLLDLNWAENAAAGTASSFFTSLALTPTELLKIRMQSNLHTLDDANDGSRSVSMGKMIKNIWKSHGLKGLYRGLFATLARECVSNTMFFGTYELIRGTLKPADRPEEEPDALMTTMVAGAFAGVAMWIVAYPLDVIKSRVQMSEKGINGGYRAVWEEIGSFRALYSGLWPTLVKTVPVSGVLLYSVLETKKFLHDHMYSTPQTDTSNPPTSGLPASNPPAMDSPPPAVPAPSG